MALEESSQATHELHPWAGRVLKLAADIGAAAPKSDALRSFTTILLALLRSEDPASRWLQQDFRTKAVGVDQILASIDLNPNIYESLRADDETRRPSEKLERTQSAQQILRDANQYAGDRMTMPQHLIAAFVYGEVASSHSSELASWGVTGDNWNNWANAFLSMLIGQRPDQAEFWLGIHAKTGEPAHCVPIDIDSTSVPHVTLGGSGLYLYATQQTWRIPADALVIPRGWPSPQILDDREPLIAGLSSALDDDAFKALVDLASEVEVSGPNKPIVVDTPSVLADTFPRKLIFTTGLTTQAKPEALAGAADSIIAAASGEGLASIAVPLPDSSEDKNKSRRDQSVLRALAQSLRPPAPGFRSLDIYATVDPAIAGPLYDVMWDDEVDVDQLDMLEETFDELKETAIDDPESTIFLWIGLLDPFGKGITPAGRILKQELRKLVDDPEARLMTLMKADAESPGKLYDYAVYAVAALGDTYRASLLLQRLTTDAAALGSHHFAVSMLLHEPRVLSRIGIDVDEHRDRLIAACLRNSDVSDTELERWQLLFPHIRFDGRVRSRRGFDNDGINARDPDSDKLDINDQARLFAELILNKQVALPLSIGLFGNWGSGKSFFMKRIEADVVELQGAPGNAARVAQITFNAWHFVDANLWASLATKIFDDLAQEIGKDLGNDPKVRDAAQLRAELTKEIDSSVRQVEDATQEVEDAKTARANAIAEYRQSQGDRVKKALQLGRNRLAELEKQSDNDEELKKALTGFKSAAERAGVDQVLAAADGFDELLAQIDQTGKGASGLWQSLLADLREPSGLVRTILPPIVVVVVAVLLVSVGVGYFAADGTKPWLTTLNETVSVWKAGVAQWGSVIVAAMTWMKSRLNSLANAAGHVRTIIDKSTAMETDDAAALRNLDEAVNSAKAKMREAERRVAKNEEELQRINAGGLVYDFLESRRDNEAYLKYKGLISTVRDDFESLEDALKKLQGNRPIERIILYIDDLDRCRPQRVVEVLEAVHLLLSFRLFAVIVAVDSRWLRTSLEREYHALTGITTSDSSLKRGEQPFTAQNYLEKIFQIPYTLARMDEDGFANLVESVLEPADSDEKEDPKPPDPNDDENHESDGSSKVDGDEQSDAGTDGDGATPAAAPDAAKDEALPASDAVEAPAAPTAEASARGGFFGTIRNAIADIFSRGKERPPVSQAESPPAEFAATGKDSDAESEAEEAADEEERAETESEVIESTDEEAEDRAEIVKLRDHERLFIRTLHEFIRTPRQTKRFVNIYRLLRPRLRSAELEQFAGTSGSAGYKASLVLLAASVGYPMAGGRLLRALVRCPEIPPAGTEDENTMTQWSEFLEATDPRRYFARVDDENSTATAPPEWANVWTGLTSHQRQSPLDLFTHLRELSNGVDLLDKETKKEHHFDIPMDLSVYKKYAVRIGPYSFDWDGSGKHDRRYESG